MEKNEKWELCNDNCKTISESEYMELIKTKERVNAFSEYVRARFCSIERDVCAAILGFDLKGGKENV